MSGMILDPENYFSGFVPPRDMLLQTLEKEARAEGIPIVGPMVGELLFLLADATNAKTVLGLGTATGYSTIYLARAVEKRDGKVMTWEISEEMAQRAEKNLVHAGLFPFVDIRTGDVVRGIKRLDGPFDLIFIDIEKKDYAAVLPDCHRLLRQGGIVIADNVAFSDAASFNRAIFDSPGWRSVHLYGFLPGHSPEQDGLCLGLRV